LWPYSTSDKAAVELTNVSDHPHGPLWGFHMGLYSNNRFMALCPGLPG